MVSKKYQVRKGFSVRHGGKTHPAGTEIELSDKQAKVHQIRIEPIAKRASGGKKSEGGSDSDKKPEGEGTDPKGSDK